MKRSIAAIFLLVGFLTGIPLFAADETYTLKLYKSKKGDKSEHEKMDESKNSTAVTNMGMAKTMSKSGGKKEAYSEEILEKKPGERKASKLTRTYSLAEKTEEGKTTKSVYAGETVVFEKKGDQYEFTVKGKALTEAEAPDLFRSFNKKDEGPQNDEMLPKNPVKVGESWTVAKEIAEKGFKATGEDKMKIDAKKSTIVGKLLRVYKKDGAQFGVVEFTLTIFVSELNLGGGAVATKPGSKVVVKITLDTCIDGTSEYEDGKMDLSMNLAVDLPNKVSAVITSTSSGTEKVNVVRK